MSYKLFIPGPIAVSEKTLRAMARPMIGHRSTDFVALYQSLQPGLQEIMATKDPVYLSTSSAWGVMEGSLHNVVAKKVLNCMNGAFSDKWNDVALRDSKAATALKFEWGQPVDPEAIRRELSTGAYDALTLIHNETSTGTMSPVAEIAALKAKYPDVMFIVDAVSSMTAVPLNFDALGIDVLLAGTQKAFALPPGLTVFTCSPAALAKAATAARDFALEFMSAASIAGVHLSRLAEEMVLWASQRFRFIGLSDAFSTGSSIMPQKKNPDVPELARGKTGRVYGDLISLLTLPVPV